MISMFENKRKSSESPILCKLDDTTALGPRGPRSPPAAAATSTVLIPCGGAKHL